MRTLVLGVGLCYLAQLSACAQCPGRIQLRGELRRIPALAYNQAAGGYDSLALAVRCRQLHGWLSAWRECRYPMADSTYVQALNQLVQNYSVSRDKPQAIRLARQAVSLYERSSLSLKTSDLVESYFRLGDCYMHLAEYENSIKALDQALLLGKSNPQSVRWISMAYPRIVYNYFTQGAFEKALLYAEEGEVVAKQVGDDSQTSQLLEQKGQALAALGRHAEARRAFEMAIALIKDKPQFQNWRAGLERLLGVTLGDLGETEAKLVHLQTALAIARRSGHSNLSDFGNTLGLHFYKIGQPQRAVEYFQQAIRIHKSAFSMSVLYNHLGVAQRALGQYELALQNHQKGLDEELPIGYRTSNIASLPPAQAIQTESQKDYLLSIVQDKAATWLEYAKYQRNDKQKLRIALRAYMVADTMIDIMRQDNSGETTKLIWRNKARSMYEGAIQTCRLLDDPASALHFFEKSRAVLLNDQLNERIAEQSLAKKDGEGIRSLRRELRNLENQLTDKEPSGTSTNRLNATRLDRQEQYDELLTVLEKKNPAYRQFRNDNHVPGLEAIRRNLLAGNGQSVLLSYFVGDSAIYGICIDDKRFIFKQLNRNEYQRHIGKFKESLVSRAAQNRQWKDYQQAAYGLYQTLIQPFGLKEGAKLIISPDGDFIPFAAFSLSPTRPDYLVQHHAISYAYSAGFLERVPRTPEGWWPSFRTFLGMAPVEFAPALQQTPLRGSDSRLQEIGGRFLFPRKLVGKEASRNAFAALAPSYRIVQLFTHASADSSSVAPKLYFSDSIFRLSDLPDTTFRTQLMVLAACQTGIGQNQRGEGVFSLARGFAAVGIPSTLTTLWSVEDQPTYGLTSLFYPRLTDGLPLDEALQQAQIEWLKSENLEDQMPYAWAGMVLVGQRAPLGRYYAAWVGGVGVALFVLLAGLIFWVINRNRLRGFVAPVHRPSRDSS